MFENREGQRVPNVTFRCRENNEWKNVTTDDIFKGKTVVVFSLPGAFTPTCSSSHVPRYNELAPVFKKHGVDEIVCISVKRCLCHERVGGEPERPQREVHPGR